MTDQPTQTQAIAVTHVPGRTIATTHAQDQRNSIPFHVTFDGDEVRIIDAIDRKQIPARDLSIILDKLKRTAKTDLLRNNLGIGEGATWEFDPMQGDGLRNTKNKPCVYFATHHARPDMIKIGYTKGALFARLRSLAWELDRDNIKYAVAVAYAETKLCRDFEKALHFNFADWRITGEWFDGEIVIEYLLEMAK